MAALSPAERRDSEIGRALRELAEAVKQDAAELQAEGARNVELLDELFAARDRGEVDEHTFHRLMHGSENGDRALEDRVLVDARRHAQRSRHVRFRAAVNSPRPRSREHRPRRTAARRAAGLRSGQDPGDDDPHEGPPSRPSPRFRFVPDLPRSARAVAS